MRKEVGAGGRFDIFLDSAGLIPGKRARGRQRQAYLHQFGKSPTTLIQDAYDRKAWKMFTHEAINIWTRQDTI